MREWVAPTNWRTASSVCDMQAHYHTWHVSTKQKGWSQTPREHQTVNTCSRLLFSGKTSPAGREVFSHSKIHLYGFIFCKPTGMMAVHNKCNTRKIYGQQGVNIWKGLATMTLDPFIGSCHGAGAKTACLGRTRSISAAIKTKKQSLRSWFTV